MPMIITEIPSPGDGANRYITTSVVTNVLSALGVRDKDIIIDSPYSNLTQPGSTVGDRRGLDFGSEERVTVEVDERRKEDQCNRALGRDDETAFFYDAVTGLKMSASYVEYEVTLTITRREPSRSLLGGWVNELKRRIDQGMELFETEYYNHWRIPVQALNMINSIYKTGNINVTPTETLKEYMRRGFSTGVTVATTASSTQPTFVMRDAVGRVVGVFDVQDVRSEKENEMGAWIASLTYRYTYKRAEAVQISYPIMVNNTLLEERWWVDDHVLGLSDESNATKGVYIAMQDNIRHQYPTLRVPLYIPGCDRPEAPIVDGLPGEYGLFVGYLTFTPEQCGVSTPTFALNLGDIDDNAKFSEASLKYLHHTYAKDPYGANAFIRVTIFENGSQLARNSIYVDEYLNVWIDYPLSIAAIYTFTITIRTSLSLCTNEEFEDLRLNPEFVNNLIADFKPQIIPKYPDITKDGDYVPEPDEEPTVAPDILDKIIDDMKVDTEMPSYRPAEIYSGYQLNISRTGIIAYREGK